MKIFAIKTVLSLTMVSILLMTMLMIIKSFAARATNPSSTTTPSATPAASEKLTPVGRVVWIKGTFSATSATNKTLRTLQKLSIIYLKDTLMTDNNSQAQIVFTDNTNMTFKPNSKFLIDQYEYNPQKKSSKSSIGKYVMNLIEGGFRTITGLIAKQNPKNYQVNTPVATIGVRGTDYAVYIDKGELFIGQYSGSPCVDNKKGSLCLNDKTKYASVASQTALPVPLSQTPAGLQQKLEITPARIAFNPGGLPNANSFCITQ